MMQSARYRSGTAALKHSRRTDGLVTSVDVPCRCRCSRLARAASRWLIDLTSRPATAEAAATIARRRPHAAAVRLRSVSIDVEREPSAPTGHALGQAVLPAPHRRSVGRLSSVPCRPRRASFVDKPYIVSGTPAPTAFSLSV